MELVVGADELEILHRRHGHAPVEIKSVVPLRVGWLPRLKKEHVSVSALLHARQLQGQKRTTGEARVRRGDRRGIEGQNVSEKLGRGCGGRGRAFKSFLSSSGATNTTGSLNPAHQDSTTTRVAL